MELAWDAASSTALAASGEDVRERVLAALAPRLRSGVLVVTASEQRGQLANRNAARARLHALVRAAGAPPPPRRRATKPTRGSVRRGTAAATRKRSIKAGRRRPSAED